MRWVCWDNYKPKKQCYEAGLFLDEWYISCGNKDNITSTKRDILIDSPGETRTGIWWIPGSSPVVDPTGDFKDYEWAKRNSKIITREGEYWR